MKPIWVSHERYYDRWKDKGLIILDRDYCTCRVLVASKAYNTLLYYFLFKYWLLERRNKALMWMDKKGIIKPVYHDIVTLGNLCKWFMAARRKG